LKEGSVGIPHIEILPVEIFQHAPFCTRSLVLMIPFQSHWGCRVNGGSQKVVDFEVFRMEGFHPKEILFSE
jgi:hypothetical protein